jgi:hypothetical protein
MLTCRELFSLILLNSGVGVFFSRQDDRPGAFDKQMANAAWIGKRRCWFLGQWMLYAAGSKL